jgi:hypothetical protein
MTEHLYCFLDEAGDPHFPAGDPGKSTHYVLGGILVPRSRLDDVREAAAMVIKKFFGSGEMKAGARSLQKNPTKRLALLQEIAGLDASFIAVAVDKRELRDDSPLAQWKRSFIKYISALLYRRLFASHDSVQITTDEYGTPDYQEEFKRYVAAKRIPDLFLPTSSFNFGNSTGDPLLQVADLVAGTVFRAIRDGTEYDRSCIALLRPRLHSFIHWPVVYNPVEPPPRAGEQMERDIAVRDYALSQAARYLSENRESNDDLIQGRIAVLDRLVYAAQFDEDSSSVYADELVAVLRRLRFEFPLSKRWLSSEVIGPLRDDGVVISGSNRGYLIPYRAADLDEHAKDVSSKAIPMLNRLKNYRDGLKLRSGGRIDLLAPNELRDLRRLVDTLSDPLPSIDSE